MGENEVLPSQPTQADERGDSVGDTPGGQRWHSWTTTGAGFALPWGLATVFFVMYSAVSVRLHQRMLTTGYDLGIFEQAVRAYASGHAPASALKGPGFNLLGDHFSPILAGLAPFYRVFPSPLTLLVAQAALFAVAVVPLSRWAAATRGRAAALVIGVGYGASWGIASAVGFDFHEICFAVPLVALAVTALGTGRWRAAVWWALPLLLVKEDLGLTVVAIGAYIAWRGPRRLGLVAAAAGLTGTLLEALLLIPAFNPGHAYAYGINGSGSRDGGLAVLLLHAPLDLLSPRDKVLTSLLLLAPTAFMALRSPLTLLVTPTLAWRFLSPNPFYWGTGFHYSAILMPIVFGAFIHSLSRWVPGDTPANRRTLRAGLTVSAAVTILLIPTFPLSQLARPATWRNPARVDAAHRIMDLIPDGATVAASNRLVPQLTNRATVTEFGLPESTAAPQWIIVDVAEPSGWPVTGSQQAQLIDEARNRGYRTVTEGNGFILLRR
ncbi:DUF2079 domain-containing protein [Streptomyces lavendulae]|uniref:DUF2079 domain-containing protein n=1 Tax=Streptomyces lavendulae TaxID=1914 RepID=UPI003817F264